MATLPTNPSVALPRNPSASKPIRNSGSPTHHSKPKKLPIASVTEKSHSNADIEHVVNKEVTNTSSSEPSRESTDDIMMEQKYDMSLFTKHFDNVFSLSNQKTMASLNDPFTPKHE